MKHFATANISKCDISHTMDIASLGAMQSNCQRKMFLYLYYVFFVYICVCGLVHAEDSWNKQMALASFDAFCEFNPQDDMSFVKILSPDSDLVNRSVGHSIEMFCADDVLRKVASGQVTKYDIMCTPFIEFDDQNRQILRYYWNQEILRDQCGHVPVCALMSETYDHPILNSSTQEMLHEESVNITTGDQTLQTMVGFYTAGTYQTYVLQGNDPCGNNALILDGDQLFSTCTAPDNLALIGDDDDASEIRTNYWLFNFGYWEFEPPECHKKTCPDLDLVDLGFSADDVVTPQLDTYLVGDSVEITCAEGQVQLNFNVNSETVTCVAGVLDVMWEREFSPSLRIGLCSVKQCVTPVASDLERAAGSVVFSRNEDVYDLGEMIDLSCADGYAQANPVVDFETLTCMVRTQGNDESYVFQRRGSEANALKQCQKIQCSLPSGVTYIHAQRTLEGIVVANSNNTSNVADLTDLGLITCEDINVTFAIECMEPNATTPEGLWVPTPHCEPKTCKHFMADSNLYEYELQYGRHIIGEPGPVLFESTLTFVCPPGTVAYERNELTYQCVVGPDGYGHFVPLEPDVKPDCRAIRCPRNDSRTGTRYDITYPYYERQCHEDGECKVGMIVSLDCNATEEGFKPFYQCDAPDGNAELATNETQLQEAMMKGVWFPAPSCVRGCGPPKNISAGHNCVTRRKYDRGEWNFPDDFIVECTCEKGYVRDDGTPPEVECDGNTGEWIVTKPCHVDCNPIPEMPHATRNISYFDTYALMEIECDEGYQMYPRRDVNINPPIAECHLGSPEWLNLNLYECKAMNGCTEEAVHDILPDIYLSPSKEFYDDNEVALALCARGYLEDDHLYQVLVCKAKYEEVVVPGEVVLVDTDQGPAPSNFTDFHYMPNVTMQLTGFEWDYDYVVGNISCITNYTVHYPGWAIVQDN